MSSIHFEYLPVPLGDKAVYGLAERYFVERLTAHFRPRGYDCYREYEYGGGSTFMPTFPTGTHMDPQKARILRMLQGGDDAFGFRFLKPHVIKNKLEERGFEKPDFLAFRAHDGVVAEIGTANMRAEKLIQLKSRLRDLELLVQEEIQVLGHASAGQPLPWHGMTWRAAPYHPEEGPVVIPVDEDRLISTMPTYQPKTDGLYLYQLLRYQRHRLPIGDPVALPRLSPEAEEQLRKAWRRFQQPGAFEPAQSSRQGWLDRSLRHELSELATGVGIAVVVVAAVAVVVAAAGLAAAAAAGAAIAGFAALLVGALGGVTPRSPQPPGVI